MMKGEVSVAPKDMMTVKEVSAYLTLDEQTIARMARERIIPALEVNGEWLFSRKSIQKWRLKVQPQQ